MTSLTDNNIITLYGNAEFLTKNKLKINKHCLNKEYRALCEKSYNIIKHNTTFRKGAHPMHRNGFFINVKDVKLLFNGTLEDVLGSIIKCECYIKDYSFQDKKDSTIMIIGWQINVKHISLCD